jgi:hypothetical protein
MARGFGAAGAVQEITCLSDPSISLLFLPGQNLGFVAWLKPHQNRATLFFLELLMALQAIVRTLLG